jgi:hypothetical protein
METSLQIFTCFMGWSCGIVGTLAVYSSDPGIQILARRSDVLMEYFRVRFQVSTAMTMKNAVFWVAAPCRFCLNRRIE